MALVDKEMKYYFSFLIFNFFFLATKNIRSPVEFCDEYINQSLVNYTGRPIDLNIQNDQDQIQVDEAGPSRKFDLNVSPNYSD